MELAVLTLMIEFLFMKINLFWVTHHNYIVLKVWIIVCL